MENIYFFSLYFSLQTISWIIRITPPKKQKKKTKKNWWGTWWFFFKFTKKNSPKSFEVEFECAEHCQHSRSTCKMHFALIFVIFAFRGVHGSHFYVIFIFILQSFYCQTMKMIQKWSQKWPENGLKMATVNNPIVCYLFRRTTRVGTCFWDCLVRIFGKVQVWMRKVKDSTGTDSIFASLSHLS